MNIDFSSGPKQVNQFNLSRKHELIDENIRLEASGAPIPGWIELSPVDLCNRTCAFCPRADPEIAPNRKLYMSMELCESLTRQLEEFGFEGTVVLGGYGEPLLHPDIIQLVRTLSAVCNTELVTNGDRLSSECARSLVDAGIGKVLVSLYDGPEQMEELQAVLKEAGVPPEHFILRPRWQDAVEDYGLILTNRAGTVTVGNQSELRLKEKCFYPHYMMMVDWNGEVFPCPQDWHRNTPMGNISKESVMDVWLSEQYREFRVHLAAASRCHHPCNHCNARGVLHGQGHAGAWTKFYESGKEGPELS